MSSNTTACIQQDYSTCEGCTLHTITSALNLISPYIFKGKVFNLCAVCQELCDIILRRAPELNEPAHLLTKLHRIRKDYVRTRFVKTHKPKFKRTGKRQWERNI